MVQLVAVAGIWRRLRPHGDGKLGGKDLGAIHLRDRVRVRVESNNRWMAPWNRWALLLGMYRDPFSPLASGVQD